MYINWNRLTTIEDVEVLRIEDVEVLRVSDDALYIEASDIKVWIPKSVIADGSDIVDSSDVGDSGELVIPEDIAIDKGLV